MTISPSHSGLSGKAILLIVSGGIAAYKALELIRLLRQSGAQVRSILTKAGAEFVTPLSLGALTESTVHMDLWSLTEEAEMGHIRLTRESDLVIVAPATANILAKMAHGHADDLATATLLASDKPVLVAPAMNVRMWHHPATVANMVTLAARGIHVVGPHEGAMACGEFGLGRMAEPHEIAVAAERYFRTPQTMTGRRAVVTSGPTQEAIDPVRFITNKSSGKQGHAIAAALARLGADVTLVTGPTMEPDPSGLTVRRVETAQQMLDTTRAALPVDVAVCAAAVSDWRPATYYDQKMKKEAAADVLSLQLTRTPDILAELSNLKSNRPSLVVGFALETENLIDHALRKRSAKGCDWIVANEAIQGEQVFGSCDNAVTLITANGIESWTKGSKLEVGQKLADRIAVHFNGAQFQTHSRID